jgi:hypothetical protein
MFQHLFHQHKTPQPRFAQGLFLVLVAAFVIILRGRPVVGLTGLGTTLILAAGLVEANRGRIWTDYKKAYRKQKGLRGRLTAPDKIYYQINIYLLWPFIAFLGAVCLYVAANYSL